MPMLRQAKPNDSKYIDPVSLYHWQCKLCGDNIMSAVISAMAIRHFSKQHKEDLDGLKQEIMLVRFLQ
jgi:hypothetical protein